MSNALVIFVKNPIPGKVKTRLAAEIGEDRARDIYLWLLQHTRDVTSDLPVTKYVYYSDFIQEDDIWSADLYEKRLQTGELLGERMHNAITEVLQHQRQVVLIGSDSADLDTQIVSYAFEVLHYVDIVIGPAMDGGYYLIGCKAPQPKIFEGIAWSTSEVFTNTRNLLLKMHLDFKLLPQRSDIDSPEDITRMGWSYK
ncbi:MAG TPA: TIGR04282 family arsenosugar biosynthesis glycosyltransferase [Saprospiraceae bacterium]|nr:TIGR04282 family arsenosugar biosynthesis glycosyltransferase [Saprospiraceae bacterium]